MSKSIDTVFKKYNYGDRGYKKIKMDLEQVIYKDYGSFDIEVSGLDNYRKKRIHGVVYIWERGHKIVKEIHYISFSELANILYIIDNLTLEEIKKRDYWH